MGVWGPLAGLREEIGVVSPAVPVFWAPCSVGPHLMGVNGASLQQRGSSGAHKTKPQSPHAFFSKTPLFIGEIKHRILMLLCCYLC